MPIWMACIPAMPSSAVVIVLLGYVSQYIYHDWVYIVAKGAIFTDIFSEQCFLSVVRAYCFEELELLCVGKSLLMLILFLVVEVEGIIGTSESDIFSEQCFLYVVGAYCFYVGKSPLMIILFVVDVVGIFIEWILAKRVVIGVQGVDISELELLYVGKGPLMLSLFFAVVVEGIIVLQVAKVLY